MPVNWLSLKAALPIVVIELPNITFVNLLFQKAPTPISVTESGIIMPVNWLFLKAPPPISITEFGISTWVILLSSNGPEFILQLPYAYVEHTVSNEVNELDNFTLDILFFPNASPPIVVIVSGIITVVKPNPSEQLLESPPLLYLQKDPSLIDVIVYPFIFSGIFILVIVSYPLLFPS